MTAISPYAYRTEKKKFPVWKILLKRKWTILIIFILFLLLSAALTLVETKLYKSEIAINFNYESVQRFLVPGEGNLSKEEAILQSDEILNNVAAKIVSKKYLDKQNSKFIPILQEAEKVSFEKKNKIAFIAEKLKSMLEISVDNANNIIYLSVVSPNPEESALIANLFADRINQIALLNNKNIIFPVAKFLKKQKQEKLGELQKSKLAMQKIIDAENIQLSPTEKILIEKLSELESELELTDMQIKMNELVLGNYENELKRLLPEKATFLIDTDDEDILIIQDKIAQTYAERKIKEVMKIYPDFVPTLAWENSGPVNIDSLRKVLDFKIEGAVQKLVKPNNVSYESILNLTKKIQDLKLKSMEYDLIQSIIYDALTELESGYSAINYTKLRLAQAMRNYKFYQKLNNKIDKYLTELENSEKNAIAKIEFISRAKVPDMFFKPNITLHLLIGGLLGLIVGMVVAYRLSIVATHIKDTDDLEMMEYKIIAAVPHIESNYPLLLDGLNPKDYENSDDEFIKSFQKIYAYIKYGFLDREIKTIGVSSAVRDEGKSIIAANVAITLAHHNHKVLLVDANLKYPVLSRLFKINPKPSLAHYLFRKETLENVIRHSKINGLDIITGIEFPQDPSVVLTSERFKKFIDKVKVDYDYVIFDCLDLTSTDKVAYMLSLVDEIIMVTRANLSTFTELKKADSILSEYELVPSGYILNDFTSKNTKSPSKKPQPNNFAKSKLIDNSKRFRKRRT